MLTTQKCLICKEDNWANLIKDLATGFVFCKNCNNKVEKEYKSLMGTRGLANWLRAIANVMERGD